MMDVTGKTCINAPKEEQKKITSKEKEHQPLQIEYY
jgi:hypothetical protein